MTGAIACGQYTIVPPGTVQLHNQAVSKAVRGDAVVTYAINSSGNVVGTPGGTLEAWLIGGVASNYEVKASLTTGSTPSGTLGSWLSCGSNNSWSVDNGAVDNSVVYSVLAVQIRDVATHTVQASASITLSAESDGRFG